MSLRWLECRLCRLVEPEPERERERELKSEEEEEASAVPSHHTTRAIPFKWFQTNQLVETLPRANHCGSGCRSGLKL